MPQVLEEQARILSNEPVGPGLSLMRLDSPMISSSVLPGQFVHMKLPGKDEHLLRRPFSIYDADPTNGTLDILYQQVGVLTRYMSQLAEGEVDLLGPIGRSWSAVERTQEGRCSHALIVGGGVGAAPLFLLTKALVAQAIPTDVILGAQTEVALICRESYSGLLACEPSCSTDDGSYGRAGFATSLVEERLDQGCIADGAPYDYVAVCGPEPLMKVVSSIAQDRGVYCEVSLEKRMACGIGACLSCVVDTIHGKKRSCVDGPIFPSSEVVW